jgi:hypothetical protein
VESADANEVKVGAANDAKADDAAAEADAEPEMDLPMAEGPRWWWAGLDAALAACEAVSQARTTAAAGPESERSRGGAALEVEEEVEWVVVLAVECTLTWRAPRDVSHAHEARQG